MREKLVSALVAALLFALGIIACTSGAGAIRSRTFDFSWRPNRGSQITFVEHYQEAAAIRIGVGLVAIGLFIGTLATVAVVGAWRHHRDWTTGFLECGLFWSAGASFLIAVLSLFPAWDVQSLPFYPVPLSVVVACVFFHRVRWTGLLLAIVGGTLVTTAVAMNVFSNYQT